MRGATGGVERGGDGVGAGAEKRGTRHGATAVLGERQIA